MTVLNDFVCMMSLHKRRNLNTNMTYFMNVYNSVALGK